MSFNKRELKASPLAKKTSKPKDVIYDPMGQWKYPGQVTRIPGGDITMQGVPYPVLGIDDQGNEQMMYPGGEYQFPGNSVTEYPQLAKGGLVKGKPRYTDKNIKTSINEFLMKRNEMFFGPRGKHFYKPDMKKKKNGGIPEAFPQQPTAQQFFERGFVPQGPVGFYKNGGSNLPEAFPQQVPANYFFAGAPWTPPQMMVGGEPCYECGGANMAEGGNWIQGVTDSIKRRGTEGKCSGANFGGPGCPKGSRQYNLAVTFRNMAKKQFGGDADSEGMDEDDYLANYSKTFMNKIKNNTMMSIADEAADDVSAAQEMMFAQYGGGMNMVDYGYNPNMMNQRMFANKSNYLSNQAQEAGQNFYDASMNLGMSADPFMKGKMIQAQGGGSMPARENMIMRREEAERQKISEANRRQAEWQERKSVYDRDEEEWYKNKEAEIAEREKQNQLQLQKYRDAQAQWESQNWGEPKQGSSPSGSNNGSTPQNTGNGTGTSTVPAANNQKASSTTTTTTSSATPTGSSTPSYNDPNAQQQWSTQGYDQGMGQGMQYFPMNMDPHMKWKTKGYPMPAFGYNPNNTYLQNYEYRGRMFGQGPRKVSMTFRTYTDPVTGQTTQVPVEEGMPQGSTPTQSGPFNTPPFTQDNSNYLTPEERQRRDKTRKGTSLQNRFANFKQNMQERRSDVYVPRADQSPYLKRMPEEEVDFDLVQNQDGGANPNYYDTTFVGKYRPGFDGEASANWLLAGTAGATSLLNNREQQKTEAEMQRLTLADNTFMAMPANRIQNQGRYNWTGMSNGMMDPNSMDVIQKPGMGMYQEGGSYELGPEEIDFIMKNGGSITYL